MTEPVRRVFGSKRVALYENCCIFAQSSKSEDILPQLNQLFYQI